MNGHRGKPLMQAELVAVLYRWMPAPVPPPPARKRAPRKVAAKGRSRD